MIRQQAITRMDEIEYCTLFTTFDANCIKFFVTMFSSNNSLLHLNYPNVRCTS
jgi:hypothetical protein